MIDDPDDGPIEWTQNHVNLITSDVATIYQSYPYGEWYLVDDEKTCLDYGMDPETLKAKCQTAVDRWRAEPRCDSLGMAYWYLDHYRGEPTAEERNHFHNLSLMMSQLAMSEARCVAELHDDWKTNGF